MKKSYIFLLVSKGGIDHFITFTTKFKPHDSIKLLTINPLNASVNNPTAFTLQIIGTQGPFLGKGTWLTFDIDVLV